MPSNLAESNPSDPSPSESVPSRPGPPASRPTAGARLLERPGWLLFLLIGLVFGPAITGPYVQDDALLVAENPTVMEAAWPVDAWTEPVVATLPGGVTQGFYRPVSFTTLWLDARGPTGPWRFHATQLVLHFISALLLFRLLRRTGVGRRVATVATATWALWPIHAETVSYISARHDALFLPLYLGALLVWWSERRHRWREVAFITLGLAAFLSKEMAVSLPIVAGIGRALIVEKTGLRVRSWVAPAVLLLAFVGVRAWVSHEVAPVVTRSTDSTALVARVGATAWHNLELAALPLRYSLDHSADFETGAIPVTLGLMALLTIGLAGATLAVRAGRRTIAWGVALVVSYGPISGLVPIYSKVADRYLYLPLLFAVAGVAQFIVDRRRPTEAPPRRVTRALRVSLAATAGVLVLATAWRVQLFRHPQRVYAESLATTPSSPLLNNTMGSWWLARGEPLRAREHFARAAEWDFEPALYNLALTASTQGDDGAALRAISRYLQLAPHDPDGWRLLAELHDRTGEKWGARFARRRAEQIEADRSSPQGE